MIGLANGFEQRRDRQFSFLAGRPLKVAAKRPPVTEGRPLYTREYSYSIIDFAMKTFWLDEPGEQANEALVENCRFYLEHQPERDDRDNFYWSADVLCRLVEFFGAQGSRAPGRLSAPAEQVVLEMMWTWLRTRSLLEDAEWRQSRTWHIWESENHHVQKFSTAWHFAGLLKDKPAYGDQILADGGTPEEHFQAWTDYAREWIRERAKKALFVETANAQYNIHTLKGVYNFYDFSPDAELQALSGRLLDLYWATWAEEQIDGVRGGGKARVYPGKGSLLGGDTMRRLAWYHLGTGEPSLPRCNDFTVLTSAHRLPGVVVDIALDRAGRGVYEIRQRPLGLAVPGYHTPPGYRLRTDWDRATVLKAYGETPVAGVLLRVPDRSAKRSWSKGFRIVTAQEASVSRPFLADPPTPRGRAGMPDLLFAANSACTVSLPEQLLRIYCRAHEIRRTMKGKTLAYGTLIAMMSVSTPAFSESRLGRFEDSLSKSERTKRTTASSDSSSLTELFFEAILGDMLQALFYGMAYGGLNSVALIHPGAWTDDDEASLQRSPGGALIPFAAAEVTHQWIDSGIRAWDWRGEVGLALTGVTVRRTFYREDQVVADGNMPANTHRPAPNHGKRG